MTQALRGHSPGEIDWMTFVGSGEPTLHSGLGEMIRQVKMHTAFRRRADRQAEMDLRGFENVGEAILSIITRHPLREDELFAALQRRTGEDVLRILQNLTESGQAQLVTRYGVRFWVASGTKVAS